MEESDRTTSKGIITFFVTMTRSGKLKKSVAPSFNELKID